MQGHTIISGTGRAGTTFLVQYFTAAGVDTGFTLEEVLSSPDRLSNAGLERNLKQPDLPQIVKSPWIADEIARVLQEGRLQIEAAIVPVRDIFAAAESRRRVYREASVNGADPLKHPGTIWKTADPAKQEPLLALQFYKLIEALVAYGVPIYMLHFPEFVQSHQVLYDGLGPILKHYGVSYNRSERAFLRVSNPQLVHEFHAEPPCDSPKVEVTRATSSRGPEEMTMTSTSRVNGTE